MVRNLQQNWHARSANTVFKAMKTTVFGLSKKEADQRLFQYGPNQLQKKPQRWLLIRFLMQFHNFLIYMLLVSAVIAALLDHIVDMFVIVAVVIVNAMISFVQEDKAEKAIAVIRQLLSPVASVLRDGKRHTIPADKLVPGDIVLLEVGNKVPADLRLFQAHNLMIQEAVLTGESIPAEKNTEVVDKNAALGDRFSMAFSGTLITGGQGQGIVVGTGMTTEIGRISSLLEEVETLITPMVQQIGLFAKWITVLTLIIAILIIIFGYFVQHHSLADLLMIVVGLSVAAIPEELPAVLTITLALGVQAMARRNAIIRHLPAIETLGAVSVICTDKTGTLTYNEMSVTSVVTHENNGSMKI